MLTVLTWLWRQPESRTHYTALHVNIWADMVRRHLSLPHRIACVTDMPAGIAGGIEIIAPPRDFEDVQIPTWRGGRPQCLRRLALFRADAAALFGERIVSMDLDCAIGAPLDPLFAGDEDFRMTRGTAEGRPYNGSMMLLRAGSRPQVYDRFTPAEAIRAGRNFVGSDQAWLAHVLGPDEKVWTNADGVGFHGLSPTSDGFGPAAPEQSDRRILFFAGSTKPWDADDRWTRRHYRKVTPGRCLVLGYGPTLWSDVDKAIDEPFAAVIASPEATKHWPGDILAEAGTNNEAARLAWMHGYDDVVWCGAEPREMI